MANWKHRLNLKDLWDENRDKDPQEIDYPDQGKRIAERIRKADFFPEYEDDLEEIAQEFEAADDEGSFNDACDQLWNWGDQSLPTLPGKMQRKKCWIKTLRDNPIQTGSKELAREQKLAREIVKALVLKYQPPRGVGKSKYQFRRDGETFGGHQSGYRAEYVLIGSKPKDRIVKSFNLRIETQGFDWDHRNDLERVSVSVWGKIICEIKHPREATVDRPIHGVSCSFNRNRPLHVRVGAVVRLIEEQQAEYDKMLARVEASVKEWDGFAQLFNRVKAALHIPVSQVWRSHHANATVVELTIPQTVNRKTSAKVLVNKCGELDLMISNLTELKMQRIIKIIRA